MAISPRAMASICPISTRHLVIQRYALLVSACDSIDVDACVLDALGKEIEATSMSSCRQGYIRRTATGDFRPAAPIGLLICTLDACAFCHPLCDNIAGTAILVSSTLLKRKSPFK